MRPRYVAAMMIVIATVVASSLVGPVADVEASGAASLTASLGGQFVPRWPQRLLDTRTGTAPACVASVRSLAVAGRADIPSDAAAVVLNVTVVGASSPGHLTVGSSGLPIPSTSSINYGVGDPIANQVTTGVGADGAITLAASSGCPHVVVDIHGYHSGGAPGPGGFVPIRSTRAFDSRSIGCLTSDTFFLVGIAGSFGVPADASGVVANITAVAPTAAGHLSVQPYTDPVATNSVLNFPPGRNVAGSVAVGLGGNGSISVRSGGPGCVHVLVDVQGYFTRTNGNSGFVAGTTRLVDTRTTRSCVPPGRSLSVPSTSAEAHPGRIGMTLTVTAVNPASGGYVTVAPGGDGVPSTSNLNFQAGRTTANAAAVAVAVDDVVVTNSSSACLHVIVDRTAVFWPIGAPSPSTSTTTTPPTTFVPGTTTSTTIPKPTTTTTTTLVPTTSTPKPTTTTTTSTTTTTTTVPATTVPAPPPNRLQSGRGLQPGQSLRSPNGKFALLMQSDGNLVLVHPWTSGIRAVFASGTFGRPGAVAVMQGDGNLVVYLGTRPLWSTGTFGNPGASLALQDDGNLVVYSAQNRALWATMTIPPVPLTVMREPAPCTPACETKNPDAMRQLELINDSRAAAGLPPLRWDAGLGARADWWARTMRDTNRFAHSNLYDGAPPRWFLLAENIGASPYMPEIHDQLHVGMHNAYMRSTVGHRENILNPATNAVGIGWVYQRTPSGELKVWTAEYFAALP